MTLYIGPNISDGMLPRRCSILRRPIEIEEISAAIEEGGYNSLFSEQHKIEVAALATSTGLQILLLERWDTPRTHLATGDQLIVISITGLPHSMPEDRHECTEAEVEEMSIDCGLYTIESRSD